MGLATSYERPAGLPDPQDSRYNPNLHADEVEMDLDPRNYPNYGNFRMVFPPPGYVLKLDIKGQADYADAITRRYARNKKFIELMKVRGELKMDFKNQEDLLENCNATAIGNMAFMALHSGDQGFLNAWTHMMDIFKRNVKSACVSSNTTQ